LQQSTVETQPQLQPALLTLSATISQRFTSAWINACRYPEQSDCTLECYTFPGALVVEYPTPMRFDDVRLRSALSDCAGTFIYSRRRKVFLEVHWVAATSRRVSYRGVADLGGTALGCQEACGGVSQKMMCTFTKSDGKRSSRRRSNVRRASLRSALVRRA
jgi:hypothetical protein